jgi:cellulose synthase operon protein C
MAETELRMGEPAKAEKRARAILEKNPAKAIGHSLLGDIALSRGQAGEALENYRRAHQTEPSTDTLLRQFRMMAGKDDKAALQLVEQWLKTHPNDVAVLRALADGQARIGNYAAARKSYESLLKLVPEDGTTLNNLANVLFRLKDTSAVKIAEQAVAKSPGNAYAIDSLGWILFQNGQIDRALQLLREARLRMPENSVFRFHLGMALAKVGRKSEAKSELEASLAGSSIFEGAGEAKRILQELR